MTASTGWIVEGEIRPKKRQARALEEAFIIRNRGKGAFFDNKIRSISRLQSWRGSALRWGTKFGKKHGLNRFRF